MRHSILLKVGDNLIYQCSPQQKPRPEASSSSVEYNRALPEWENTTKNYIVKSKDSGGFAEELQDEEGLRYGLPIKYDLMEIYSENGKNYARKKNGDGSGTPVTEVVGTKTEVAKTNPVQQVVQKKEHGFRFEVAVSDDDGEPILEFKNDAPEDSMEHKILKSFTIKAVKGGVVLEKTEDGKYKLKLMAEKNN